VRKATGLFTEEVAGLPNSGSFGENIPSKMSGRRETFCVHITALHLRPIHLLRPSVSTSIRSHPTKINNQKSAEISRRIRAAVFDLS